MIKSLLQEEILPVCEPQTRKIIECRPKIKENGTLMGPEAPLRKGWSPLNERRRDPVTDAR
jgi:hypothetical protein